MAVEKKYYWLKLKEDFFKDKEIKKLRKIAGGDTYTIIYLKLMLLGLRDECKLFYEGIEDTFAEELALELDEDSNNVKVTLMYMLKMGLLQEVSDTEMFLTRLPECVGKETAKAELMRKKRAREKLLSGNNVTNALPPVTKCYTEIDIEKEKEKDKEIKRKKFTPPTLEDVQEYCKERKNNVDAKQFYDFYTAGDWIDSKGNKVKNWKQKIITWEKNATQTKPTKSNIDETMTDLDDLF